MNIIDITSLVLKIISLIANGKYNKKVLVPDVQTLRIRALWAVASYCNKEDLNNWTCGGQCQNKNVSLKVEYYDMNPIHGSMYYIGIKHSIKTIVVSFRG